MKKNKLLYIETMKEYGIDSSCPCEESEEHALDAFRFLYEPINSLDNWIPPYVKAKIKADQGNDAAIRGYLKNQDSICGNLGLSFYATEIQALKAFSQATHFKKMKLPFTCLGIMVITPLDGVVTPVNGHGHFDLHLYTEATLVDRFVFVKSLQAA